MEPLSSAAGIISLGIEAVSGALKIQDFIRQMRDAPSDTKKIASELVILSRLLSEVNLTEKDHTAALRDCLEKLRELDAFVESVRSGITAEKRLMRLQASFRHVRKANALRKLKELLEHAQHTLLLAMVQRGNSLSQDLQSCIAIDRELQETHYQNLQKNGQGLARQNAANHDALLARIDGLAGSLGYCSVSTTAQRSGIEKVHWEGFRAEITRLASKIQDDALRTNLQCTVYESLEKHFKTIIEHDQTPNDTRAQDLNASHDLLSRASLVGKSPRMLESSKKYFFGNVYLISEIRREPAGVGASTGSSIHDGSIAVRSTYIFHPSFSTIVRGLRNGLQIHLERKAIQGWRHALRNFNAVSSDARIFELCRQGNTCAVQQLFDIGEASPWDVDQDGWTPLHHAAFHHHHTLCRLLLDSSSDSRAMTYPKPDQMSCTPFDHSIIGAFWWSNENDSDLVDFLRWSSDTADMSLYVNFSRVNPRFLADLSRKNRYGLSMNFKAYSHVLSWSFRNCFQEESQDLENTESMMRHILFAVYGILKSGDVEYATTVFRDLLVAAKLNINHSTTKTGQALIHVLLSGKACVSLGSIRILLAAGADPHLQSQETRSQIPTETALQCGDIFWLWRQALVDSGYDLHKFVEECCQFSQRDGWSRESLVGAFHLEFTPLFSFVYTHIYQCWICGSDWFGSRQRWWRDVVHKIRSGSSNRPPSYHSFIGIPEDQDVFALTVKHALFNKITPHRYSRDELVMYDSIWSEPSNLQSTCVSCIAKIRDLSQKGYLSDVSPPDVLLTVRNAIREKNVAVHSE